MHRFIKRSLSRQVFLVVFAAQFKKKYLFTHMSNKLTSDDISQLSIHLLLEVFFTGIPLKYKNLVLRWNRTQHL